MTPAMFILAFVSFAPPPEVPVIRGEGAGARVEFPPDADVPRSLTDVELEYLRDHPISARGASAPPTGPVVCPGEYAPQQAVLLSWLGTSGQKTVLAKIAANVTTLGEAEAWVVVANAGTQASAASAIDAQGGDLDKVKFFTRTLDTIWIRDYGPRYIYEGGCRAIVDHTYNRPRPKDDEFPQWFAGVKKQPVYDIPLIHGGGNYHLSTLGDSYATRLTNAENPTLTESQIVGYWHAYENVDTTMRDPYPNTIDSTQHLDMWVQVYADRAAIVSDWPADAGSAQDNACEEMVALLESRGYDVDRVPARRVSGTHYTYTNVVICNDLLLVPTYTNSTISNAGYNDEAFDTWRAVWETGPGRKAVQIDSQALVTSAGVMHCVMMHVPAPIGGTAPTAYLRSPNGGEWLLPGDQVTVAWITDDDAGVSSVDLELSYDGGATYPTVIASATEDDGSFTWTVPDTYSAGARLRVTARDAQGHTGADSSDANFTLAGSCPPDFNRDGFSNGDDFDGYVAAFGAGSPAADFNGDGFVTGDDFDEYSDAFEAGC